MYPKSEYTSEVSNYRVELSKKAEKQLEKIPAHIIDKLDTWVDAVERT